MENQTCCINTGVTAVDEIATHDGHNKKVVHSFSASCSKGNTIVTALPLLLQ